MWLLFAFLIGFLVRLTKDDGPAALFVPPKMRPLLAVTLGVLGAAIEAIGRGVPWRDALFIGLAASNTAMLGHVVVIEGARRGRELPLPWKGPSSLAAVLPLVGLLTLAGCLAPVDASKTAKDAADLAVCVLMHEDEPPEQIALRCAGGELAVVLDVLHAHDAANARRRARGERSSMGRRFGGPNGYGHRLDPEDIFRVPLPALCLARAAALPREVDYREHAPPPFDQGQTGSCTAHAFSAACVLSGVISGERLPFVPSPDEWYKLGRAMMRRTRARTGVPLPLLTDTGLEPSMLARAAAEWGAKAMGPKVEGRNSDCDPRTVNDEPTLLGVERDAKFKIVGPFSIDSSAFDLTRRVRSTLAGGVIPTVAVWVDRPFEEWTPAKGPLGVPDHRDPEGGWHDVYVHGYYFDNGRLRFRFRSSWGEEFGDAGDAVGDEGWLAGARDVFGVFVRPVTGGV